MNDHSLTEEELEQKRFDKYQKAVDLCNILGIKVMIGSVYIEDLYDLFTDEEKLKVLVSKLKNRAFW